MSRVAQVIEELDRIAPGLLDYSVDLNMLPRPPSRDELTRLNALVPLHSARKIHHLLHVYQEITSEPEEDDRWVISYRFAKTEEERSVLGQLQKTEAEIAKLETIHERVLHLKTLLNDSTWPPAGTMRTLLKQQHDMLHVALTALHQLHNEQTVALMEYATLARATPIGEA